MLQVPPPENMYPQEYGKPLKMAHAIVTDPCLSAEVLQQIEQSILFYKGKIIYLHHMANDIVLVCIVH